jgi:hypothetical protein
MFRVGWEVSFVRVLVCTQYDENAIPTISSLH